MKSLWIVFFLLLLWLDTRRNQSPKNVNVLIMYSFSSQPWCMWLFLNSSSAGQANGCHHFENPHDSSQSSNVFWHESISFCEKQIAYQNAFNFKSVPLVISLNNCSFITVTPSKCTFWTLKKMAPIRVHSIDLQNSNFLWKFCVRMKKESHIRTFFFGWNIPFMKLPVIHKEWYKLVLFCTYWIKKVCCVC